MKLWHKLWLTISAFCVLGLASADWYGYAPGTCTDRTQRTQGAWINGNRDQMQPCSSAYTSNSIRSHHYSGGK